MRLFLTGLPTLFLLTLAHSATQDQEFLPGANYDPEIPTLTQVVGHDWGEKISSYAELTTYVQALAHASERVELIPYAHSWEGRDLYLLVIADKDTLVRLNTIRQTMQRMASADLDLSADILEDLPCIVWLGYGIHGNEISGPDAALLTAYHLVAATEDSLTSQVLDNCITLIDPTQNPDGRDRFVNYFRRTRGRWPDPENAAAEHHEDWPGGRTNHYFFDMNRDWFAMTQPETRGRIRKFLEWYPQVLVDLHEMGGNSTYYFPPPADPINPELTESQLEWLDRFGQNNARWFDALGIDYFTREVFDSFYPGYGEGWPMFHGTIGMTYEQASVRGLVLNRDDNSTLSFRESVHHHFVASLSTLELASRHREDLLRSFFQFRRSAVKEASKAEIKEFLVDPRKDPERAAELVNLLMRQGVRVHRTQSRFRHEQVRSVLSDQLLAREFEKGAYLISLGQPAGRLARTLMTRHTLMDEKFLAEQERRQNQRIRDQIFDVTAWSLPLLYDVDCYAGLSSIEVARELLTGEIRVGKGLVGGKADLAYLVRWGTKSAFQLLARLHRKNIRVFGSDRPFSIQQKDFPAGSLIIRQKDNPEDLYQKLRELSQELDVTIDATGSSWVESGVNFGSNQVKYLHRPRIAMAYGQPTLSGSVGATRYLIEHVVGYPVTVIHTRDLPSIDLSRFNVLLLPDGSGSSFTTILRDQGIETLKHWVRGGGTLVTFAGATEWLTEEKVGLLSTVKESRQRESEGGDVDQEDRKSESKLRTLIQPEKEDPPETPGAIVRIMMDPNHWLAFGYDEDTTALVTSRRIFSPLRLDKGRNVATYAPLEDLVLSGLVWPEAREQLANKAYLMHQSLGRGHIVAFAEDPSFRAYLVGLHQLIVNAVFLGPAH